MQNNPAVPAALSGVSIMATVGTFVESATHWAQFLLIVVGIVSGTLSIITWVKQAIRRKQESTPPFPK